MKKIFVAVCCLLVAGVLWQSCRRSAQTPLLPSVVVSGYVPYTLVRQLVGEAVPVEMLLPAGAEPHAFEPTPFALVQLQNAAAFIYTSAEIEPWAADLAQSAAGKNTPILELAATVEKSADPHVWMNLQNAQKMVFQLAQLLMQLFPQEQEKIQQNYAQMADELTELETQFQQTLTGCAYKEVVHIGHLAFGNLLTPYGIKLTALSGTSHEGEHSAQKLVELVRQIKAQQIPAIFTEETLSPRLAQTVAAETGVEILNLYPIEHISKRDFDAHATYADLMRRNLQNLARGLKCPAL